LDGAGTAAVSKGSLALAANTNGNYTVRRLAQSQAYTVCATNGSDTASASFSTQAMAGFGNPAWQVVGTAGFSAFDAYYQSLAFAPDGTPYVAYQDRGNVSKTTVMRFNGTAWQVVGTAGFSAGFAAYQSLAFAPDGTPYVAYSDYGNGGSTTVMRFNGTAWQAVGTAGFSAGDAYYQSLAFAPDGTPYVAYSDDGNSSKTTVMRLIGTASAPTGLAAVAGNGAVTLSWTAPASNGGSAIQSYAVTGTPAGGGATVSCPATAPATTCTVPGLTNGLAYTFTVTATNAAGTSSPSASATATPQTAPGAPTGLAAVTGNGAVTLTWTAPARSLSDLNPLESAKSIGRVF
jgi:hypothetical protein